MDLSTKHRGFTNDEIEGRILTPRNCFSPTSSAENGSYSSWDRLPEELVARILALLPFSNIYLARCVCKKWRSTIWSPLFFAFCKLEPLRMPWLLEFQQHMYNQAWAYDLAGCRWFHLNFFFLPENASVVAASGGLVCLGRATEEGYILFVCNPLTKDWKKLPLIPVQPGLVLVDVDQQSNFYKIIALILRGQAGAGSVRPTGSVLLFDARYGIWRETTDVPRELRATSLLDATVSEGILYCLTTDQGIEAYDIDQGVWSPVAIAPAAVAPVAIARFLHPPRLHRPWRQLGLQLGNQPSVQDSYILDRQGQLVMVTNHDDPKMVIVNEFDTNTRRWRRADHFPAATGSVICAGRFSSLCLTAPRNGSNVYLMDSGKNKRYCVASRSWHQVPRSPLSRHKLKCEEIRVTGLWFEPRIDATTQVKI